MYYNPLFYPIFPSNCDKPPTIYAILESIVNYGTDNKKKIAELAKYGRTTIFDFEYPLSSNINKEDFECMILNNFLMRRIGYDTVTAFKIRLNVKLNEIMPLYNKMFDLLSNNTFDEKTIREGNNNKNSTNNIDTKSSLNSNATNNDNETSDRRYSKTPQNELEDVKNGIYVSDYNYDTNTNESTVTTDSTNTSNSTNTLKDDTNYNETITRIDVMEIMKNQKEMNNIYTLIFKDLEPLFYQLI